MPLNMSGSKAAIGQNIGTELGAGKPHKQAVAIALNVARHHGGKVAPKKGFGSKGAGFPAKKPMLPSLPPVQLPSQQPLGGFASLAPANPMMNQPGGLPGVGPFKPKFAGY